MKLFISKKLWAYRRHEIKVKSSDKKNRSKLIFHNLKGDKSGYESLKFTLPVESRTLKKARKDLIIECSELTYTSDSETSKTCTGECIYALLCCGAGRFADDFKHLDIFVPANMKSKVEVLEKIQFYLDLELHSEDQLTEVYLIKISLSEKESIPLYLADRYPNTLKKHWVFRKDESGRLDVGEYKTCILLNAKNHNKYVSLSKLQS